MELRLNNRASTIAMNDNQDESPAPAIRFKRRKIAHPRRTHIEDDAPTGSTSEAPSNAAATIAQSPPNECNEDKESVPNLKEILRNRKRPRDRFKETERRSEPTSTDMVQHNATQQHPYTSRFIAQTGQVVDRDDKQMTKYVEARIAEQNHRKHGWPIPAHLGHLVSDTVSENKSSSTATCPDRETPPGPVTATDMDRSIRLAAGHGKIEEVEIESTTNRTDLRWKKLDNGGSEEVTTGKVRLGRDGKPRPPPKRRNSDDVKRDQMVEAVLSEARLDFFDAEAPTNPHTTSTSNNDEAILERFRAEYYESLEEAKQQQRKPAPPVKGAKEVPKGPKMGGSKSARAKMRLQEERATKTKK